MTITTSSNSFVGNSNLVTKVYFPRLIMPIASTLACLLDLLIGMAILLGLSIYYQVSVTWQLALTPLFLFLAVLQAAAIGILFSALNVRFRDVQFGLPFILQIWMLASPVFYPTTLLSEKWKLVFAVNPLTGILEGFRGALFGTRFEWEMIGISCLSIIVLTLFSIFVFRKMEDDFADMI
jgi:lipopolysaccharide transport system permease protein